MLTCTELFILQFSQSVRNEIENYNLKFATDYFYASNSQYSDLTFTKCVNQSLKESAERCNFKKKFENCHKVERKEEKSYGYIHIYDIIYSSKVIYVVMDPVYGLLRCQSNCGCSAEKREKKSKR